MLRIIMVYIAIAIFIFVVNLIRYMKVSYYQMLFNANFANNTPIENYKIQHSIISLLRKAKLNFAKYEIDTISNPLYCDEINNALNWAKGYFHHQYTHCLFWPLHIIEKLTIFLPARKIKNKFISFIFAIIEFFLVYLLGLYLDTTGIGNKILTYLLDFSNHVIAFLRANFH